MFAHSFSGRGPPLLYQREAIVLHLVSGRGKCPGGILHSMKRCMSKHVFVSWLSGLTEEIDITEIKEMWNAEGVTIEPFLLWATEWTFVGFQTICLFSIFNGSTMASDSFVYYGHGLGKLWQNQVIIP